MDILKIYKDYGVPHETEGHKHCRPGWVNTTCPFCTGNPGLHLGATLDGRSFVCWRCGWKPAKKALAKLLSIPEHQVREIIIKYGGTGQRSAAKEVRRKIKIKKFKLPSNTGPMKKKHRQYLESRGFDPDHLQRVWGLLGTGPVSLLDKVDYKNRILAPIYWDGQQVSFQARDITDRHPLKYMACMEAREVIPHKRVLYGKQSEWGKTGICVEGITDVWRLGTASFATLGIKYTPKQVRLIAGHFRSVHVMFDNDPQARQQSRKLVAELKFRGVDAREITIDSDPGDLSQADADYLIKNLL